MFESNPITGVGAGNYEFANGTKFWPGEGRKIWLDAHSLYFKILGELGLIGIITFRWICDLCVSLEFSHTTGTVGAQRLSIPAGASRAIQHYLLPVAVCGLCFSRCISKYLVYRCSDDWVRGPAADTAATRYNGIPLQSGSRQLRRRNRRVVSGAAARVAQVDTHARLNRNWKFSWPIVQVGCIISDRIKHPNLWQICDRGNFVSDRRFCFLSCVRSQTNFAALVVRRIGVTVVLFPACTLRSS